MRTLLIIIVIILWVISVPFFLYFDVGKGSKSGKSSRLIIILPFILLFAVIGTTYLMLPESISEQLQAAPKKQSFEKPTPWPELSMAPVEISPVRTPLPVLDIDYYCDMEWVDSSCFSEVGYDAFNEILYVRFRDSGSLYRYLDFPDYFYSEFMNADSLGGYYNQYIKGEYECQRLD